MIWVNPILLVEIFNRYYIFLFRCLYSDQYAFINIKYIFVKCYDNVNVLLNPKCMYVHIPIRVSSLQIFPTTTMQTQSSSFEILFQSAQKRRGIEGKEGSASPPPVPSRTPSQPVQPVHPVQSPPGIGSSALGSSLGLQVNAIFIDYQ